MPCGLKNAAQCFQRNEHQLRKDLPSMNFVYMDNVIVGSEIKEVHVRDLRSLFRRLKDTELLLNKKTVNLGDRRSVSSAMSLIREEFQFHRSELKPSKGFRYQKRPRNLSASWASASFFTVSCDTHLKKWRRSPN